MPGATYTNRKITTFAEHGDAYDPDNWPSAFMNKCSQLVIGLTSWAEAHPTAIKDEDWFPKGIALLATAP